MFFFEDTATTPIYSLSLHDALPISPVKRTRGAEIGPGALELDVLPDDPYDVGGLADLRSEEHTSELQSHSDLVCRLLLEKKNAKHTRQTGRGQPTAPVLAVLPSAE